MNINNNFTPLAWHKGDIELQSNRATYAFGHIVPLIAHYQTLIPFQIIVEHGSLNLEQMEMQLCNIDGTPVMTIHPTLTLVEDDDYDVVIYNGDTLSDSLPIGQYFLMISSATGVWFSDVVTIVSNVLNMTCMEWWDVQDLTFGAGAIVYKYAIGGQSVQYKNRMYFLEEIGMPEYTVEEEGETRDGLFYSSKILSGKKYKMNIAQLTEAMCDALRFVHLSDRVEIRDGYGRMYYCDNVLITPEWQSGAVASASVEITTDTFVKQVGRSGGDTPEPTGSTGVLGTAVIGDTFVIGA